jgi:large subunit ribosomal protein L13
MKTFFAVKKDFKDKKWHVVDAKAEVLGRLASRISRLLTGKVKTSYTPHVDTGDGVIVVNAKDIRVTGRKASQKVYTSFSGYPSGIRRRTFERVQAEDPTFALKRAVKGMLPKNRLGRKMLTRLLVYPGSDHPHSAQKPILSKTEGK